MEQEAAFIRLEQGTMTVPEYEAKFAALSRYALEMVDTDAKRCRRFRLGLNPNVLKELVIFRERDYADLVEMARKAEKSLRDCRDKSEFNKRSKTEGAAFGRFGGGNSRGGQQRSQSFGNQSSGTACTSLHLCQPIPEHTETKLQPLLLLTLESS
ncbi:hypothetical protein Vadar_007640 [Vaccinium darrowii]|uniref:Uncharacterized protein n=1 Tax=Vaccinium darrowii TaxID=229202 RepID=A0ACB7ZIT3_9ERIC|nr:hypothetical protein Vadar_007640 [Vaccinium darrowii]